MITDRKQSLWVIENPVITVARAEKIFGDPNENSPCYKVTYKHWFRNCYNKKQILQFLDEIMNLEDLTVLPTKNQVRQVQATAKYRIKINGNEW